MYVIFVCMCLGCRVYVCDVCACVYVHVWSMESVCMFVCVCMSWVVLRQPNVGGFLPYMDQCCRSNGVHCYKKHLEKFRGGMWEA